MLGFVLGEGEHVVEDAGVHGAVEVDDADVAGEELEDGRHVYWRRRLGVVRNGSGKRAVGRLQRFVHDKVVLIQG